MRIADVDVVYPLVPEPEGIDHRRYDGDRPIAGSGPVGRGLENGTPGIIEATLGPERGHPFHRTMWDYIRRIDLDASYEMTKKILVNSSEMVTELVFQGTGPLWNFCVGVRFMNSPDLHKPAGHSYSFSPADQLPSFPALTTIEVKVHSGLLSAPLVSLLSRIRSAPALSSITFEYPESTRAVEDVLSVLWVDVDKWLAWLATSAKSEGGLTVVLPPWPEENSSVEGCLPKFRKAGGELRVDVGISSE